ncbi:MAG: ribonuclease R [Erysipelotrichaceae bacterium]
MDYKNLITETLEATIEGTLMVDELKTLFQIDESTEEAFLLALKELKEDYIVIEEEGKVTDSNKCGYKRGVLKVNPKGFGFIENADGSVYVNQVNMLHAMNNDEVVATIRSNKDDSVEGKIIKITKHANATIIGVIKVKDDAKYFLADQSTGDHRIKILNFDDFKLVNDTKVVIKVETYGATLGCNIQKIIGYKYEPGVDITSILFEHGVDCVFPDEVSDEAQQVPDHVLEKDKVGRNDFTNKTIITVDSEEAKDLDDAISVEKIEHGYRLGVHIADVSYYVTKGTKVDEEAYKRGTSVYVVDRVVPMLPQILSNGMCSLNPKVERLTLSAMMDLDMSGNMMDYKIVPSFIKTTERMSYNKVNEIIAKDETALKEYPHLIELIDNMVACAKIIRDRRISLGNIDFDKTEAKIIVNAKGKPIDIVPVTRGLAELIIEDFMIAANECVAAHVSKAELPSIYRVHETPDPERMRDFAALTGLLGHKLLGDVNDIKPIDCQRLLTEVKGLPEYQVISTSLLRSMAKARYDDKCLGHFGLGLEYYTHFTSPIRRYPDLIVHRMLRKYCFTKLEDKSIMKKDNAWISECALNASIKERQAIEAERDVDDMKKAEYMEQFIGVTYDGIISSITKFGMFVELPNTIEGLVHISNMKDDFYHYEETSKSLMGERTGQKYAMGDKVVVKVNDASRFKKQIDFVLKDKNGNFGVGCSFNDRNKTNSKDKAGFKKAYKSNGNGKPKRK